MARSTEEIELNCGASYAGWHTEDWLRRVRLSPSALIMVKFAHTLTVAGTVSPRHSTQPQQNRM
jgi:hypothetical protein